MTLPLDYLERAVDRANTEVHAARTEQAWCLAGVLINAAAITVCTLLAITWHPGWTAGTLAAALCGSACIVHLASALREVRSARAARRAAQETWVRAAFDAQEQRGHAPTDRPQ